jgi:hypothetical protein
MSRSSRVWVIAAVLAAAATVALALLRGPHGVEVPAPPPRAAAPSAHPSASTLARFPSPPVRTERPLPPGVSAEQWAALEAELAGQPLELERLAAHYAFADLVRRYRATPAGDARRALALQIDAGLDARLEAGELSAGEARLIKLAMLRELQPDEAARRIALSQWEAALAAQAAGGPEKRSRAQDEDFQRRQQELVAAWRARPPAERDPKRLERELDALRSAVYRIDSHGIRGTP